MRTRLFGNTNLSVSEYGIGTWAMGGGMYGVVDDEQSIRAIHRAKALGVNLIDTAPMYGIGQNKDGRAEEVVGKALAGRRDQFVICTKYGRHLTGREPLWENLHNDWSSAQAAKSLDESLTRLKTDYIDVLFVHSPPASGWNPQDAIDGMLRLKKQGKIRVIGFSFWQSVADTLGQVEPFMRSGELQAVQVILSLLQCEAATSLLKVVHETRTAVVAREALAMGFLTDSFSADTKFDKEDFKAAMKREDIEARLDKANQFKFLIGKPGIASLASAALNYTLSFPEVACVIPGAKTPGEVEQCLAAADAPAFDGGTMKRIADVQSQWSAA